MSVMIQSSLLKSAVSLMMAVYFLHSCQPSSRHQAELRGSRLALAHVLRCQGQLSLISTSSILQLREAECSQKIRQSCDYP